MTDTGSFRETDIVLYSGEVERSGGIFKESKRRPGLIMLVDRDPDTNETLYFICPLYSTVGQVWEGGPRLVIEPSITNGLKELSQIGAGNLCLVRSFKVTRKIGNVDSIDWEAAKYMVFK